MNRGLAPRKAVAGSLFEGADAFAESLSGSFYGWRFFNFRDKGGADDGGIGKAAKNRNMTGKRNAETDSDGKLGDAARPSKECGEIVGEDILCARNARAGNEIEKTGRAAGNLREALVGRSGRAEENCVEMMSRKNAAIVFGFLRREVGGENAVSASGCSGGGKFFKAHLQDGIVVAEENERNLRGLANTAYEVENAAKSRTRFECPL